MRLNVYNHNVSVIVVVVVVNAQSSATAASPHRVHGEWHYARDQLMVIGCPNGKIIYANGNAINYAHYKLNDSEYLGQDKRRVFGLLLHAGLTCAAV